MAFILSFFDFFLPARLRNSSDLMRSYIIVGLISSNILVSLLVLAGLLFYLDLGENTVIAVGLDLICLVGYLVTLFLLKKTQNHFLCSNFLIAILAFVIFFGIQITGGYLESPILQLALQLPVTAFLLLGLRSGIVWLLITLALCLLCYISASIGFGYTQLLQSQELVEALYISLQFILLIMLGGALVIYEMINGFLNTQLNEERNRFEHKASHDDLTGIPNRFEFFRRLKSVIDEARRRQHRVGIVYIDLDDFKPINDIHGHHTGDEVLKVITMRLQKVMRLADTTARLGGDEFGLILPGIQVPSDITFVMPRILAAIKEPVQVNGLELVVHGSCGIAIYPTHSRDLNTLCQYADIAMYLAKKEQDSYVVYENGMSS